MSTHYTAGGMPLAFTQVDCLVQLITDHVRSKNEGNVFTRVGDSVHMGEQAPTASPGQVSRGLTLALPTTLSSSPLRSSW